MHGKNMENLSKPLLILMCGAPGSGKSTLAKKLAEQHNAIICSADDYHMVNGEYKWKPENVSAAHAACRLKACAEMSEGRNVIVDNTNTSHKEVKPYIDFAKMSGHKVIYVEPDTEWRYNVDELVIRNTHNVPRATISAMVDRILNFKKEFDNEGK